MTSCKQVDPLKMLKVPGSNSRVDTRSLFPPSFSSFSSMLFKSLKIFSSICPLNKDDNIHKSEALKR